jgi:hypothetical protein
VWVGPVGAVAEKLRFTYTMTAPDERRIEVYTGSGTWIKTFNWTTTVPFSGTELVLDTPAEVTGLQIRLRYGTGLLTKIEIYTDYSFGPPPPNCFWTRKIKVTEVCD